MITLWGWSWRWWREILLVGELGAVYLVVHFFFLPWGKRARYTDHADGQCLTDWLYGLKLRNIIRQLIPRRPGKGGMHMWMDWMSKVWIYLCLMGFQRGISSEDKHNNQVDEMVHSMDVSLFLHPALFLPGRLMNNVTMVAGWGFDMGLAGSIPIRQGQSGYSNC